MTLKTIKKRIEKIKTKERERILHLFDNGSDFDELDKFEIREIIRGEYKVVGNYTEKIGGKK